jgi:hypothetical protein
MKHISEFIPPEIAAARPLAAQSQPTFFGYRHIAPLVYGMPEWIVEALQPDGNRLLCWCAREFDAAMITAALNGDRK